MTRARGLGINPPQGPGEATIAPRPDGQFDVFQEMISRLPPQLIPSTTRSAWCQDHPSAGSISGSESQVCGSSQGRLTSPEVLGGVSSYAPDVNNATRRESAVDGCIAPGRPSSTITEAPW
ncbi:hypothetical protein VO63_03945 [Streptomyces showdoensis]|uniref:Uncharacterized protein n=1 Tax=Streptomyces showdoensis TaxID=68268 RepID=A0A2P2GU11_STREW|nr:hypothetical protein VO63_03945 [Streptomyces showdoensis]